MANEDQNTAEFNTGFFGLKLGGRDAISIFLFIVVLASMGLTVWENGLRSSEHDQITCMIKLNLFVQSQPQSTVLDWAKMPVDLYPCVPRFLYDRQTH